MRPRIYQVNQNNPEETLSCILCAPDQRNAAGHHLMRELQAGDVLFHYDSHRSPLGTHALSVVEEVDLGDSRLDPWRASHIVSVNQQRPTFVAYTGRHLTQVQPSNRRQFLLAFSRTCLRNLSLPNAFPRQMIYLREIEVLEPGHRAALQAAGIHL